MSGIVWILSFLQCVCSLYMGMSSWSNLGPHTLRLHAFVPYLFPLNVTRTTWLLSPTDKIPSSKDGSCPTFQKRVNTWSTHPSTWEQAQNCGLKPACILTNISNSFPPPTVRMHYNPISNRVRVMGSLHPSHQRVWIQHPFCKVSIHFHLYITADRRKQNIGWYECHASPVALFLE